MSVGSAIDPVAASSPAAAPLRSAAPVRARRKVHSALLDRFGAFLGIACAIHCIVVPLALGVLPALGLELLADERVDHAIVATAGVAALLAAWLGWRAHREARIVLGFVGSVGLLIAAHAVGEGDVGARALSVAGGVGLAVTHLWNTRRSRTCAVPGHDHPSHARAR